jgi:RNA polymerase sigma factor (sigma-70 family)
VFYNEMQAKSDAQLLREYARQGSEAAFGQIVARYADLVYSAVVRQVASADLAEEVSQSVFTDLARKAPSLANKLGENVTIAGWLYRGSRFAVSKHLRAEHRRRSRESQAMQDLEPASATPPDWERIRPLLDEAMAGLGEEDRQTLLLRFFQNQTFRTVGQALGISDDAAQKRVARALEKLRARLARHGITTPAALLSAVLSSNAIQNAPAGLAARLAGGALANTLIAPSIMSLSSIKIALITTVSTAALAAGLTIDHHSLNRAEAENAALRQQLSQLNQQAQSLAPLQTDTAELDQQRQEHLELLKLRGQVGILRDILAKKLGEPVPSAQPANVSLQSVEKAEALRAITVNELKIIGHACRVYSHHNGGQLPTDWSQLGKFTQGGGAAEAGVGTNSFEIVSYDNPLTANSPSYLFYAREIQPRQLPYGIWSRVYLCVDGSVQTLQSADDNFSGWENQFIQQMQARQAQQGASQ